ncbi:MAG TPA: 16S rRNA (adenine(1518)-N(6)/adenine(1519)-N(6))-dimethyltransferase RsmA [Candidatus Saccharimonadales bacterium]|nr:16S rRNA (adenine(1518)-N(6)/adenine(1519)-N(6))-dimethyltransferase RsmA [Candidatus Saccharimonadales bacterium]
MTNQKKSLGQHWLQDEAILKAVCDSADLDQDDTVLEIGPGSGNLTRHLVERVKKVVAVELDGNLAAKLPKIVEAPNLEVIKADILKFELTNLPVGYKVVANIPYYLTSNLLRTLSESSNPPAGMTLLVQKEVAERICAGPGQMSVLAVSVQLYYECTLGIEVPARLFTPPPKVDSQVVILKRRPKPLFADLDTVKFFRIVKAGFSEKRKKLRSSLAGGLNIAKDQADNLLGRAGIDGNLRAQELSMHDWHTLYKNF